MVLYLVLWYSTNYVVDYKKGEKMNKDNGLFSIMSRIDCMSNQFTKTDWKIFKFIKNNTNQFLSLNAQELGKVIGTSDASVIRFSQKIGFSGLNEMRYSLQSEMVKNTSVSHHTDYSTLMRETQLVIENIYHTTSQSLVSRLRLKVKSSKRCFLVALDDKNIADIISEKFMAIGINIIPLTNINALKMYGSHSESDDLFIVISYTGNSKALSSVLEDITDHGSYVALISNYEKSLCADNSDIVMLIPKTNLLISSAVISKELIILTLFDLIFQNFITEDTDYFDMLQKTVSYINDGDDI